MSFANKEAFFRSVERRYTEVTVPVVGTVRIRSLTERERGQQEAWMRDKKGELVQDRLNAIRLRMIVDCVVDENGQPVFSTEDIGKLRDIDVAVTMKLAKEISKHCGFSDSDQEELAGNSGATDA